MKQKTTIIQNLRNINVLYEDSSVDSPNYFQITEFPQVLTAGKNVLKLKGHPNNLVVNSYVQVEVTDSNGNVVYSEILNYLELDKSRVVSIYVYPDTASGTGYITLTGEAKTSNANWQGKHNVRWTRPVQINPTKENESEVIFTTKPIVSVSEFIGVELDRIISGSDTSTISNQVSQSLGTVKYIEYNGQPTILATGFKFSADMVSGSLTVSIPTGSTPIAPGTPIDPTYGTQITKVITDTSARVKNPYRVTIQESNNVHTYSSFDNSPYELTWFQNPVYSRTQNSQSFALIDIRGLVPATGDVYRIKTYTKSRGSAGTWKLVDDTELVETELYIDEDTVEFGTKIGLITSQSIVDNYWEAVYWTGNTTGSAPTLLHNTSSLMNSIEVDPDVSTNTTTISNFMTVKIKDAFEQLFVSGCDYRIKFDAKSVLSNVSPGVKPRLHIYMSGSGFAFDTDDRYNQNGKITGKYLGTLEPEVSNQLFDDVEINFTADKTGYGIPIFVLEAGNWLFSNIECRSDNTLGFTPNFTRIRVPVDTTHKFNRLDFKIEYFNKSGVKSNIESYVYDVYFEGGNRYIDGPFNLLTGSLYVADSLSSGIAITGLRDTGYIRSLGYTGFNDAITGSGSAGFLMWSGSALSGSGDNYAGVGLELVANSNNYFRYRTNPSELDIRTENFFVGDINSQFISASAGVLEISSSNFHLSSSGDVFLRGDVSANFYTYKTIVIDSTNFSDYFKVVGWDVYAGSGSTNLTYPSGSFIEKIYTTVLDLRGINSNGLDNGTGSATYLRFYTNPVYPVSHILVNSSLEDVGASVIVESYGPAYSGSATCVGGYLYDLYYAPKFDMSRGPVYSASPALSDTDPVFSGSFFVAETDSTGQATVSAGDNTITGNMLTSSKYVIDYETGDWSAESFTYSKESPRIISGSCSITSVTLESLSRTAPGARIQFTSGDLGWRIQSITNYHDFYPLFQSVVMDESTYYRNLTGSAPTQKLDTSTGNIFIRNGKFVIQYKDSGSTVRYKTIDLTTTTTTWGTTL